MKSHVKPLINQLTIAVLFLSFITVVSFGIRHIRFRLYRNSILESSSSTADSQSIEVEPEPEDTVPSDGVVENEPEPQPPTKPVLEKEMPPKAKSLKKNLSKSKGLKNLPKISLSDYENLYVTEKGEQWYVAEEADGSVSKSQVQIDDVTGEVTFLSSENYTKSGNNEAGTSKD